MSTVATPTAVVAPVITPTVDASAGAAGATPPASESGAAAPAEPSWYGEKVEITVNGNKKMVTVKEARDLAQKASGADDQFRSAKAMKDQVDTLLKRFGGEPEAVMKELGLNPDEIADAMTKRRADAKKLQEDDAKLTPEQRELKQLRQEKAERERVAGEEKTKKEERAQDIKDKMTLTTVSNKIETHLEKLGLPKTKAYVYEMAKALQELNTTDGAIVDGKFPLEKLVEIMKARGVKHMKFSTDNYNPELLHQTVGDEAGEAYVKWYLANKHGRKKGETTQEPGKKLKPKRNLFI